MKSVIRRQSIVERLVDVPKGADGRFWAREMKFLKILEERYSLEFLNVLTYHRKVDSLAILCCKAIKPEIDLKFRIFNKTPVEDDAESFIIGVNKCGEDYQREKKPRTVKEFLYG